MNDRTNGPPTGPGGAQGPEGGEAPAAQPTGSQPPRTRAEERIADLGAPPGVGAEVARLQAELARAEKEAAEAKAGWQRTAADLQNYRRRTEQERAERLGLASDSLLLKVVALADDFDLAVEHVPADAQDSPWVQGVVAIDRKLRQLLESEGVTTMESVGRPFDPREHEAIAHEDATDVPDGTVLRELQRGYRIRDRVLRPALVAVARNDQTRK